MSIKIYHNPRCGKSRQTLQLLQERELTIEVIEYLKTPLSIDEIEHILQKLAMNPRDLMRKKEATYKEQHLDNPDLDRRALINALITYPILIERPIVLANNQAAIGRPPEAVLSIL